MGNGISPNPHSAHRAPPNADDEMMHPFINETPQTPQISRAHHHHPPLSSPRRPRRATLSASTGATTPLHGPRVSAPPHRPLAVYSPSHAPVPSLPLSPRASRIASARGESHRVWRAIGPLFVSLLSVQSHSLLPRRGCCTTLWGNWWVFGRATVG
jgi:hypothetical protein